MIPSCVFCLLEFMDSVRNYNLVYDIIRNTDLGGFRDNEEAYLNGIVM